MKDLQTKDNRLSIIAIDHGSTLGALTGLENLKQLFTKVIPFSDAILVSYGSFSRNKEILNNTAPILRCDGGWSPLQIKDNKLGIYSLLYDASDAQYLGAAGVVCMAVFGDKESESSLINLAKLARSAQSYNLPVIGEVLFSRTPSILERRHAVRIAAELGSNIIKTEHPGDNEEFASLIAVATVPVLVLGGPFMKEPIDALKLAADSISVGAAGVAFGRNIWQQKNPGVWAKALYEVIHNDLNPDAAFQMTFEQQ
jgi:DhnA family fructose-bisphosphate aldolase class Ia